ncbi:MAG TPA: NAD(P)-dependent oxidoreductase [Usitatibacter sp.]|nr:NAD(P)-dependent oxidoreductase [Usitatibacter sp.]
MKLLVTGASGFVGRNLLLALPRDWAVTATYNRDASFPGFVSARELAHVRPLRVDLGDAGAVSSLDEKQRRYDACVYLAANGDPAHSEHAPAEDLRANAAAMVNVVNACRFGHLLFFSSGAVYDGLQGSVGPASALKPTLPYAISKWASERYVMHAQKKGRIGTASVARFFGAYGPYEAERKIYGRLVRQFAFARSPGFTVRGDGRNLIDAMYIDDAVRGIRLILDRPGDTATFDFFSGRPLSLKDLVTQAAATFGLQAQIEYAGEVPEYIEFRSGDRTMETRFGFKPSIELPDGLARLRDWMQHEKPAVKAS